MVKLSILGIPVNLVTLSEAVELSIEAIKKQKRFRIMTANAEMIMQAQDHSELRSALQNSELVVADGAGVVWASKEFGTPLKERVAGVDLAYLLLEKATAEKIKVFFLGASPHIAEIAASNMRIKFPGLQIAGVQDGFFQESEDNDIIALINQSGAEILFVALGSPKQELWLEKHKEILKPYLRMGVGGTFDVMADQVKRAPKWMQENSLEWLYRAIGQPSRWKRLMALPKFVLADNTDFPDNLFVIHLEYPRFIIDLETEDIEFLEELDESEEVELKEEMDRLIDLAGEFYEREITRFAEEE